MDNKITSARDIRLEYLRREILDWIGERNPNTGRYIRCYYAMLEMTDILLKKYDLVEKEVVSGLPEYMEKRFFPTLED